MSVLVIRHALSRANDHKDSLAFGRAEAGLMEKGVHQAVHLGKVLGGLYRINIESQTVAVSEMYRTQQTARVAGFKCIQINPKLNEVASGISKTEIRKYLDNKIVPKPALKAAENILKTPPPEDVWFAHGLVIAGLSHILGIAEGRRFIPEFCEIRDMEIR